MYFQSSKTFKLASIVALTACASVSLVIPAYAEPAVKAQAETDVRFLQAPGFEEYPLASALFLDDELTFDVSPDGSTCLREHEAIKLLNEVGVATYGSVTRVYDASVEEVTIENAKTITPDGQVVRVPEKAITQVPVIDDPIYQNQKIFVVEFPHLTSNSVIEYDLITKRKAGASKYWAQGSFMENLDPMLKTSFVLNLPTNSSFTWHSTSPDIGHPERSSKDGVETYRWHRENGPDVKPLKPEPFMPHPINYLKTVEASNCPSWEELGNWYGQEWDKILAHTEEFGFTTTSISSNTKPRRQRVQDVLDWFASKYAVEDSIPVSILPHTPNELLKCKVISSNDGAMLLNAMFKKLGVDAYPVLATHFTIDGDLAQRAPSLDKTDRIILRIPSGDGHDWWVNPTDPAVISNCPPTAFQQHTAINLGSQGQEAKCVLLPSSKASDYIRDIRLDMLVEDRNADIALNLTLKGETGNVWRSYMMQAASLTPQAREHLFTWLSQEINKEFAVPTVPYSFYFPDYADVNAPFEMNTTVISAGISAGTPDGEYSMPLPIFGGDRLFSLLNNKTKRAKPIDINHPFIDEIRVHVELPKGAKITSLPEDIQVTSPYGSFRSFTRASEREAWLYSRLEVNKGWFDSSELPELMPLVQAQSDCYKSLLKYTLPEKVADKDSTKDKSADKTAEKSSKPGQEQDGVKAPADAPDPDGFDLPVDLPRK